VLGAHGARISDGLLLFLLHMLTHAKDLDEGESAPRPGPFPASGARGLNSAAVPLFTE
jgi:hypothetical protein